MTSPELIYFGVPGRAEPIRIMLHAAGVDFTDTRVEFKDWPELKPTTPLGSMPVLKLDEKSYCQSLALARYAGKLCGWYPEDPLQALTVDEAMDSLNELGSKAPQSPNDEEKKAKREEFQKTVMAQYASFFEERIKAAGGCGFLSSGFSVADLLMESTVGAVEQGFWDYIDKDFFAAYPCIMKTAETVRENPKVKAYYASLDK